MNNCSPSTRAILLLTAPLFLGRKRRASVKPLAVGEYSRLARRLRELGCEPADLLRDGARTVLKECRLDLEVERLDRLLERGFLLSQAMEHWRARALWVTSRADPEYPRRLKQRLRDQAPPVLYGCGNDESLDAGGLAVVGSRKVDDTLIAYAEGVGRLAAGARRALISGGARGVDQAGMRGALDVGGTVVGVLADSLERTAIRREYRSALMDGRLVLLSPYDPSAAFLVGRAMQRNKVVYALADAALVVNTDFEKGGTWAGAIEQIDRHRFVPVYVRATGELGRGLEALLERGARRWPAPDDPEELRSLLDAPTGVPPSPDRQSLADELFASAREPLVRYLEEPRTGAEVAKAFDVFADLARSWLKRLTAVGAIEQLSAPVRYRAAGAVRSSQIPASGSLATSAFKPAEDLFANARELLLRYLDEPRAEAEVAEAFQVRKNQAHAWLKWLVADGAAERLARPLRYRAVGATQSTLHFPASGQVQDRTAITPNIP